MGSTLSQRLKTARKLADLRQEDIAQACTLAGHKVSRSGVAQWEFEDERRTTPSLDQLKVVAKRTGTTLEWLINDRSELSEIYDRAQVIGRHESPMPITSAPSTTAAQRIEEAFVRAVEFAVLQKKPELGAAFGRTIGQSEMSVSPDFVWGDVIADIAMQPPGPDTLGHLLMAEQATGRRSRKMVILLDPKQSEEFEIYGVQVVPVSCPDVAAEKLISLTKH